MASVQSRPPVPPLISGVLYCYPVMIFMVVGSFNVFLSSHKEMLSTSPVMLNDFVGELKSLVSL